MGYDMHIISHLALTNATARSPYIHLIVVPFSPAVAYLELTITLPLLSKGIRLFPRLKPNHAKLANTKVVSSTNIRLR